MSKVLLGLAGDVLVNRDDPEQVFREIRGVLKAPDIVFGNLEGAYTDEPHVAPGMTTMISGRAANLGIYSAVGFNVMSLANNHILDVGSEGMLDTRRRLRAQGVETCGAGANLEDAHRAAMVGAGGLKIAFLAYASVFPMGYEARSSGAGIAVVRAYDMWRTQIPGMHMPGVAPVAISIPDEGDLARLSEDIRRARDGADLVVTSFHWGDQARPYRLTDHERRTARYSIDCGADLVVGHHQHAIRGIEWYRGKPIFYGLGHLVFDFRLSLSPEELQCLLLELSGGGEWDSDYVIGPREGWPWLPMHPDMRMTMLGWALADGEGVSDVGFLPCMLTPEGAVRPLKVAGPEGKAVVTYLGTCISTQNLNGRIDSRGAISLAGFRTLRVAPK